MSPFRDLRRRIDDRREDGFSLLEVVVALGLFALVTAGTLPMVLSATRAGLVTKLDTGAKALAQERVEFLRSLPYHLDNSASTGLDLLDQYYPAQATKTAAAISANGFTSAASGWVAETSATVVSATAGGYRLPSEPATGAFYRVKYEPTGIDGKFTLFTTVQFLDADKNPYPQSGMTSYRSVDASGVPVKDGTDAPPTSLVGVTVTAFWTAGELSKRYDVFTEVSQDAAAAPLITAQGRVTAVQVTGLLDTERTLTLRGGVVDVGGSLSTAAAATASGTGAVASITPDLTGTGSVVGASGSYFAPADGFLPDSSLAKQPLLDPLTGLQVATFGPTALGNLSASAQLQPNVAVACGSTDACARALVRANSGEMPLAFNGAPLRPAPDPLLLDATKPLVYIPNTSGGAEVVGGRGYITSTASSAGHDVTVGLAAKALISGGQTLRILPTSFALDGLVQIDLNSAGVVCTTNGSATAAPVPSYSATVRYWKYDDSTLPATAGYQTLTLSLGATDPLTTALLATKVAQPSPGVYLKLSDYISSWGSLTSTVAAQSGRVSNDGNHASTNIEGVVTLETVGVRSSDPSSGVAVRVGAMSCTAEDHR